MAWDVEYTDEFGAWWNTLDEHEQEFVLMATPFINLLEKLPQARRERIEERAQEMLLEMALQELRQKRHLTQQEVADRLNLQQAASSKMESQSNT
jgi:hypothetical protein